MKRISAVMMTAILSLGALAASDVTVTLLPSEESPIIQREIYGQFAEHLGTCIYGGLWVGEDSPIPNQNGYRLDVLNALKELHVPVLRWPGGCFADEYHWMDGIGPREKRPRMVNTNWGGTVEDNSFGTHDFFNLCEILGAEPYLSGNVGSGSVEELAKWVEYITAEEGPMANLRKQNGREKPWKLKYLGVGNESWGCGGNFRPEYYADVYRRYQTYCRNFNGNKLYKIASGASDYDYNWTEVMMQQARRYMHGISLHYYTVTGWSGSKGSATQFGADDWYWALGKCLEVKDVVKKHCDIMDKYDPEKRIGLMVDEWGTWFDEEPGTIKGHLFQQNTLRDAMVAALSLNVFHTFTDRVKMTNIAQIANVLQSMVLTKGDQMVMTPTYYVFKMYIPHQNAKLVPLKVDCPVKKDTKGRDVPMVSATASQKDGAVTISLANTDLEEDVKLTVDLNGIKGKVSAGEILTAKNMNAYNDFGQPENVTPKAFDIKKAKVKDGKLTVTLPSKSIVSLTLK